MNLMFICALLPTFATYVSSTLHRPNFLHDASNWLDRLTHNDCKNKTPNCDFAHEILITSEKMPQGGCLAAILKENLVIALLKQFESLHYRPEIVLTLTYYDGFEESNKISKKTCLDDHLVMLVFENAFTEGHYKIIKIWTGTNNFDSLAYKSSRDGLTKLLPTKSGEMVNTFIDEVGNSHVSDVILGSSLLLADAVIPTMLGLFETIDSKKKTIRFLNVNPIKYPKLMDYVCTSTTAPNSNPTNFEHEVLITSPGHDPEHPEHLYSCLAVILSETVTLALKKCLQGFPKWYQSSHKPVTLIYHDQHNAANTIIQKEAVASEKSIEIFLLQFETEFSEFHYQIVYIWNGEDTFPDNQEMFEIKSPQEPNIGIILKVENVKNDKNFATSFGNIIPDVIEGSSLMIPRSTIMVGLFYSADKFYSKIPYMKFLNVNTKIYPRLNVYVGRVPKP